MSRFSIFCILTNARTYGILSIEVVYHMMSHQRTGIDLVDER